MTVFLYGWLCFLLQQNRYVNVFAYIYSAVGAVDEGGG